MSPEFGATCAIFPIDAETLRYLRFTGRPPEQIELVEAYAREQGLWHDEHSEPPVYSDTLELDLGDVEPSLAGPRRAPGPRAAERRRASASTRRSRDLRQAVRRVDASRVAEAASSTTATS